MTRRVSADGYDEVRNVFEYEQQKISAETDQRSMWIVRINNDCLKYFKKIGIFVLKNKIAGYAANQSALNVKWVWCIICAILFNNNILLKS